MARRFSWFAICGLFVALTCGLKARIGLGESGVSHIQSAQDVARAAAASDPLAQTLGIEFIQGSTSTLIVQRNGKRYLVDLAARSIAPDPLPEARSTLMPGGTGARSSQVAAQSEGARLFQQQCAQCHGPDGRGVAGLKTPDFANPAIQASLTDEQITQIIENGKPGTMMPAWRGKMSAEEIKAVQTFVRSLGAVSQPGAGPAQQAAAQPKRKTYTPGDDALFTLPTGRPVAKHGLYVNFAHRFPFFATFTSPATGGALLGLDSSALPSFGFRYGVTDRFSVDVYREPTLIGRSIQLLGVYNVLEEQKGNPFNMAVGLAIQGQNDFSKNFTESLEGIFSKSITSRAQFYLVPTVSLNNRPLQIVPTFFSSDIRDLPGYMTFSLGAGFSVDIRPTVALVAEVIPTLVNGTSMGIHRPAFSFGIQKKIWRHAFTLGWTTSPGVTVAERAGTRASFLGQPSADTPSGLFIGFNLTRQLF
jgi:mono/diheme cytochrome c family protein